MGKRTSYEPGTFSWVELHTHRPGRRQGVLRDAVRLGGGRRRRSRRRPAAACTRCCKLDGETVAALTRSAPQQTRGGRSAELVQLRHGGRRRRGRRAGEGARRRGPRGTVRRDGRRADGRDRRSDGRDVRRLAGRATRSGRRWSTTPGCLTINELSTNDVDRARASSTRACSAGRSRSSTPGTARPTGRSTTTARPRAATAACASWRRSRQGVPPHWMPYFTVGSADGHDRQGTGGRRRRLTLGPFDIPTGARIARAARPAGRVLRDLRRRGRRL